LGPDWDAPRLAQVDTSVQVRQRVQEFGRNLAAAERRGEQARVQEQTLAEAEAESRRQAEAAARQLLDLPAPPIGEVQVLKRQQEAVRQMRAWLQQRQVLTEKLLARRDAREEAAARASALERQLTEPAATLPWWLGLPWLAAGLALGGWFLSQRAYLAGGLSAGAGLTLAGLFFWLARRQATAEARRRTAIEGEMERVEESRDSLSEAMSALEKEIAAAESEISLAAQIMGRKPPGDVITLEDIAADLEQAAARLRDWLAKEQEKRQADDHLAQAGIRRARAQAATEQAVRDLKRLQEEWAEWLTGRGFSQAVRPEGFEAVLQAVENSRSAAKVLDGQRRRLHLLAEYLASTQVRIGRVLAACGRPAHANEPGLEDLDALRRALGAALTTGQRQRLLAGKLEDATLALDLLESRRREQEKARHDLLLKAGATDAEDFRRRGAAFREWHDLIQQADSEETALRRMAGSREAQVALEEELSRIDPVELQEKKARREVRLNELHKVVSQDDQEIGDLKGRLKLMEQDEQLGNLLFQQSLLKEQLAGATRRWATLTVCRHLLEEARGVYERERQPQVIREADGLLSTMAHGRYRLLAAVGEAGVHLEDRSLARKEEPSWSAGLADQVYLAIRLGLAREFGRHSEPLPVILDDVLVKFDPSRRVNAVRVILDFAREQQVLLFSCHPEFLDLIADTLQDSRHQETAVAGFAIADGVINRMPAGTIG
jgi:uncharacterized protein YhaN